MQSRRTSDAALSAATAPTAIEPHAHDPVGESVIAMRLHAQQTMPATLAVGATQPTAALAATHTDDFAQRVTRRLEEVERQLDAATSESPSTVALRELATARRRAHDSMLAALAVWTDTPR